MQTYRILVRRHGRLLGHLDLAAGVSPADCADFSARLPAGDGYALSVLESVGERRLLESTPAGIRLLAAEHVYEPARTDPLQRPVADAPGMPSRAAESVA